MDIWGLGMKLRGQMFSWKCCCGFGPDFFFNCSRILLHKNLGWHCLQSSHRLELAEGLGVKWLLCSRCSAYQIRENPWSILAFVFGFPCCIAVKVPHCFKAQTPHCLSCWPVLTGITRLAKDCAQDFTFCYQLCLLLCYSEMVYITDI